MTPNLQLKVLMTHLAHSSFESIGHHPLLVFLFVLDSEFSQSQPACANYGVDGCGADLCAGEMEASEFREFGDSFCGFICDR